MSARPQRTLSSADQVVNLCNQQVSDQKLEQLRNRPEQNPEEKCKENHAVAEDLKKQINVLGGIRKSDDVDARLLKITGAIDTLKEQSKPLKKSLNSTLFSTDTELMELLAQTTRETLLEIGASAAIDPIEAGKKVGTAFQWASDAMKHYKPDMNGWCDEWMFDNDLDDELYNDIYGDAEKLDKYRMMSRAGFFHRHFNELRLFSGHEKEIYLEPSVWPFNADFDFPLQLVDVEKVEKPKKQREKVEKTSKKDPKAELVKVNDKASNVQQEEVSISNELKHVLSILRKELKNRKVDSIGYYEFVTNPKSFSRTVENMFYISYLMRDREVFLIEVDGVPMLKRPSGQNDDKKKELIDKCSWHGVTSLSYEQWTRLAKVFKKSIIEPLES